jgi:hypothetical protein
VIDDDAVDLVGDILELVGDAFEVLVNLAADHEAQRVAALLRAGEVRLEAAIVNVIDLSLDADDLASPFLVTSRNRGRPSSIIFIAPRTFSAISFISGSKSEKSYNSIAEAHAWISSIVSSIAPIRAMMAPRSNGVRKLCLTSLKTLRMISSASCSRSWISLHSRAKSPSCLTSLASASAAATQAAECISNKAKKSPDCGTKRRNQSSTSSS